MSLNLPPNLKYTKEHEWTDITNNIVTVGITDFAQSSLGDIVFVELPEVDSSITKDESFGVVESIKSVSDLYSPLSGKVIEINNLATEEPELLNQKPYDTWLIKLELSKPEEVEELLSSSDYLALCE
ncbi:MAG: glycine cleavage system protein GcvH [Bdellovibrionales bacterium]|nr:glycine cleavage system protein GcvH [Bdellovibrionales bacterium]